MHVSVFKMFKRLLYMFTCFQYHTHTKSDDGICICADNGELLNTVYKMIDYYWSLFWALKIKVYNDLSFYSTLHIQNFWLFLSLALSWEYCLVGYRQRLIK